MTPKTKNMTEGKPLSLIISFALPLMVGNVFQQMYTVVDTMVVGKSLGVDALAALGATDWLYWMMLGIIQGVTQGFAILMSREFGAQQLEKLRSVVGSSVILSAVCALVFLVGGQLAVRPMLQLLRTPPQIREWSVLYLRILFSGVPIIMVYNLLACILRSLGDGKTPLNAMIVAALTNIALDLLFVLVFRWGIVGAAAATLLAQLVSGVFCLLKIRKIDFMTMKAAHYRVKLCMGGKLMALGIPMALQNAIISVGGLIIQSVVNGSGVAFIAGFTATGKLCGVLEIAAVSYGYAMITYVSQNLGAGKLDRIRQGMRSAQIVALITSTLIAAVMILFGRNILGLFLSGTEQEVARAGEVAYRYLTIMSICLPLLYILHVTRSAVQGMGNTVLPMVSGVAEFVMRTGGILILPAILGETGIFIPEVLAWMGADLILVPSYLITMGRARKKTKAPVSDTTSL